MTVVSLNQRLSLQGYIPEQKSSGYLDVEEKTFNKLCSYLSGRIENATLSAYLELDSQKAVFKRLGFKASQHARWYHYKLYKH